MNIKTTLAAASGFLALMMIGLGAVAQTKGNASISEIEKEKRNAETEIRETKAELGANEKKVSESLTALRKIDEDIAVSENEIATVQGQLNTIQGNISKLEGSIATEEQDLGLLRGEYLKAVKKMRVARKKNSGLAFLFASQSFNEARRRMRYMREFSDWKDRRSGEILGLVSSLKTQRGELVQARNDADVALKREVSAKEKLSAHKQEQQATVETLRANSETLRSKIARRQADARRLSGQISALIAEQQAREAKAAEEKRKAEEAKRLAEEKAAAERQRLAAEKKEAEERERLAAEAVQKKETAEAKAAQKKETTAAKPKPATEESDATYAEARKRKPRSASSATTTTASTTTKKTESQPASAPAQSKPAAPAASTESGFGGMKGSLPKPVGGNFKIVSAFGVHPISPELPDIMDENLGIDAHVAKGSAACAVYDGEVIKIYDGSTTPGFRNIIVVKHGDYITVYANLESLAVKTGQKVKQGQKLGTVGTDFDDPKYGMIHFEVWKNQTHLNPAAWIKI